MNIDDTLLAKLEKLAMIETPIDKKESIKKELAEIVQFVENINTLELDSLEAIFNIENAKTPLRDDIPQCDHYIGESILKNAPKSEDGYFVVPKIIG